MYQSRGRQLSVARQTVSGTKKISQTSIILSAISLITVLSVTVVSIGVVSDMTDSLIGSNSAKSTIATVVPLSPTVQSFDTGMNAPLPNNRIVAVYGIIGGSQPNGPASTFDLLNSFLPQLRQLGQQYSTLDPVHPVKLALDLVINVFQPCSYKYCASFADDASVQAYIDFSQKNNLLLFFDFQLGTEPVSDALTEKLNDQNGNPTQNSILTYLQKYSFTELALDTEFHFPNTPQGISAAEAYNLGSMDASEANWTINELAQIPLQYHLPRKVLVLHQWNVGVFTNKNKIQINPGVSVVLQSDGFGYTDNKLGDYQLFVQQQLIEYGGYKLFFHYNGGIAYDIPLQTPQEIMQLYPQPLFISYQ